MENKIHSHPKLEEKLGLDKEHVIIDRELYHEILVLNGSLAVINITHFSKRK